MRLVDGRLRAHRPNASFSAWDGHLKGGNQKHLRGFAPQIFLVGRFFPTLRAKLTLKKYQKTKSIEIKLN